MVKAWRQKRPADPIATSVRRFRRSAFHEWARGGGSNGHLHIRKRSTLSVPDRTPGPLPDHSGMAIMFRECCARMSTAAPGDPSDCRE
jgi:hypothetical protein